MRPTTSLQPEGFMLEEDKLQPVPFTRHSGKGNTIGTENRQRLPGGGGRTKRIDYKGKQEIVGC